jgi:hypothetical protein
MNESVEKGLAGEKKWLAAWSREIGQKIEWMRIKRQNGGGTVLGKAVARAIAAMETNAWVDAWLPLPQRFLRRYSRGL